MKKHGYATFDGEDTVRIHPMLPVSLTKFLHDQYGLTNGINNSMNKRVIMALEELRLLKQGAQNVSKN